MAKTLVEDQWPHGRRVIQEQDEEVSEEQMLKFLDGIALAAKTSGLLDLGPVAVLKTLKRVASRPTDIVKALRKMGASAGRAKRTFQGIRKDL